MNTSVLTTTRIEQDKEELKTDSTSVSGYQCSGSKKILVEKLHQGTAMAPYRTRSRISKDLASQPYEPRAIEKTFAEISFNDIAAYNIDIGLTTAKARQGKFSLASANFPAKSPTALSSESCPINSAEDNDDEPDCRGVFVVSHQTKILFSEEMNIKSQETPTWKPCVVIDNSRLEDGN
jgi:hypothetical protein